MISSVESFQVSQYNNFDTTYHVENDQISASLDTSAWQATNDDARIADQRALNDRLHQLENNKQWLKDMLSMSYGRIAGNSADHVSRRHARE